MVKGGEIYVTTDTVTLPSHIRYGFFTRCGGTSEGLFGSLNCSTSFGDSVERVEENRRIALLSLGLGLDSLVLRHQTHSTIVEHVTTVEKSERKADGLVTTCTGMTLGVLTADCTPVVFYSSDGDGVVGIAHVGWRGAWCGLVEEMVRSIRVLGVRGEGITMIVGPCIGWGSYEVSEDFPILADEDEDIFRVTEKPNRYFFDLRGYIVKRALRSGVSEIHHCCYDTYREEELFFSARRAYHRGEEYYGHCLSMISKTS